jgi:hypothetical protein
MTQKETAKMLAFTKSRIRMLTARRDQVYRDLVVKLGVSDTNMLFDYMYNECYTASRIRL